jgi:hypothetical protein
MGSNRSPKFVKATPDVARSRTLEILGDPASEVAHAMLVRAAEYPAMTLVWEKLRPHFGGKEHDVVKRLVLAYLRAVQMGSVRTRFEKYMFKNYP